MNQHMETYKSGRRFLPYGWGIPTVQCCGPTGPSINQGKVTNRACAYNEPALRKYCHPSGINQAPGPCWTKNEYDNDKCRGRGWSPETPGPINVELKIDTASEEVGDQGPSASGSGFCSPDPIESQSSNMPRPLRCPPGNKAERATPIIPDRAWHPLTGEHSLLTTNQRDFYPRTQPKVASFRPPNVPYISKGEFVTDSMYRNDFRWHVREPYKTPNWAYGLKYKRPSEPMTFVTSYSETYQKKIGKPAISAKRKFYLDPNPPHMNDLSSYKVHFVPHCLPEKALKKTNEEIRNELSAKCPPFEGLTTYKRDYQNVKSRPSQLIRHLVTPIPYGGRIDDRTTYRVSYEPYYFNEVDGIPAEHYDNLYPPKDKCADARCYPEVDRTMKKRTVPVPPCPQPQPPFVCPTSYEMNCAPRTIPCVSPYKISSYKDDYNVTNITLRHNTTGDLHPGNAVIMDCPPTRYPKF